MELLDRDLTREVDWLVDAIETHEVEIRFNLTELNSWGRPTHSKRDNAIVMAGPFVLAAPFTLINPLLGLAFFVTGVMYVYRLGQPWMFKRCMDRAFTLLRSHPEALTAMWADSAFELRHHASGEVCSPPDGDVRGFIRRHMAAAPPAGLE